MIVLKIGILGRDLFDEHREWWSRLGAWLNIVSLAWVVLCLLSLYSPRLVAMASDRTRTFIISSGGVLWAAWTAAGVLLSKRETVASLGASARNTRVRKWIVAAAPYAFILGLLVLLSVATFEALTAVPVTTLRPAHLLEPHRFGGRRLLLDAAAAAGAAPDRIRPVLARRHQRVLDAPLLQEPAGTVLPRRIARPAREKPERAPDPFTGFDAGDDFKLAYLRVKPGGDDHATRAAKIRDNPQDSVSYVGPLPIINTALNLVKGDDLAWQERKAQSFVFTPCYSGYDYRHRGTVDPRHAPYGFRQTASTDIRRSGFAPARPSRSPARRRTRTWVITRRRGGVPDDDVQREAGLVDGQSSDRRTGALRPRRGLLYLLNELFGLTNDRTHFVNLRTAAISKTSASTSWCDAGAATSSRATPSRTRP